MFWLFLLRQPVTWGLLVVMVILFVAGRFEWRRSRRLRAFANRPNALVSWQSRFPGKSIDEITTFLHLFANSFSLPSKCEQSFAPDDRIREIYAAKYPAGGIPDEMEFESLVFDFEDRYQVDLNLHWRNDITLGDIFELSREPRRRPDPD
jgi:hypothetical protein